MHLIDDISGLQIAERYTAFIGIKCDLIGVYWADGQFGLFDKSLACI